MIPSSEIIYLATSKARQSKCRYKISAIGLDKRSRILGTAMNKLRLKKRGGGLHAEIALIRKYGPRLKSIIICRTNKRGWLLDIQPCKACEQVAKKRNIKIYSVKDLT